MDEIRAVQWVILIVDAPVHVDAATRARVPLDGRARVHDRQLVLVRSHAEFVARHDRDLREQRAARFPALRAAANVVMGGLALDRYCNLAVRTLAVQRTASEVCA